MAFKHIKFSFRQSLKLSKGIDVDFLKLKPEFDSNAASDVVIQMVPLENGSTNEDFDDVLEALINTGGK